MAKILIVEDDTSLCEVVASWLKFQHHTVEVTHSGAQADLLLRTYQYEIVILDWALPDVQGIEVLQAFRSRGGRTPVLMLTGKGRIEDKEQGLDVGADDYLTKPFDVKEVGARIRALLRRPDNYIDNVIKAGSISLNLTTYEVTRDGTPVKLFPRELALLEFFMRNPGHVFTGEALIERVWKSEAAVSLETLRTSIRRLRKQIDRDGEPSIIENLHGIGYKLNQ